MNEYNQMRVEIAEIRGMMEDMVDFFIHGKPDALLDRARRDIADRGDRRLMVAILKRMTERRPIGHGTTTYCAGVENSSTRPGPGVDTRRT